MLCERQQSIALPAWINPKFRAQPYIAFRLNIRIFGAFAATGLGLTFPALPDALPQIAQPVPQGWRFVAPFVRVIGTAINGSGNLGSPGFLLRWHVLRFGTESPVLHSDIPPGSTYPGWQNLLVDDLLLHSEFLPSGADVLTSTTQFGFGRVQPPVPLMLTEGESACIYVTRTFDDEDAPFLSASILVGGWLEPMAWSADGASATLPIQ